MSFLLSDGPLSPLDEDKAKRMIEEWIAAIDTFYQHYIHLCVYADTYYAQQAITLHPTAHVGQCPIERLDNMREIMQKQLDELLLDLDQLEQSTVQWTSEKLLTHTRLLNQLNRQALAVCQLASQSAS